jgi:fido (protein-threonine AMPylation protein)
MKHLSKRQQVLLAFVQKQGDVGNKDLVDHLELSRATVIREVEKLVTLGKLESFGKGRGVRYREKEKHPLGGYIDTEEYFLTAPDKRNLASIHFNSKLFDLLAPIFSADEQKELVQQTSMYRQHIKKLSDAQIKKDFERLTIELAWKSSQIEGNTYTLIETEILIKEQREAKGHAKSEATMILNHKVALDYIRENPNIFKRLSLSNIREFHALLVKDLGVETGLRNRAVRITGTQYQPLDNKHQIIDAMDRFVMCINKTVDPFGKAVIAMLMIAYIQPFEDGNKRTSRMLGNALLYAHSICPLSFRSADEIDYKKAMILFYEQNNIYHFKRLFVEQYRFAVSNYFL